MPARLEQWQHQSISCMIRDGKLGNEQIADAARCSVSSVKSIRRKMRCYGSTTLLPEARIDRRKVTEPMEEAVLRYVDEKSDVTLREMQRRVYDDFEVHISMQTISKILKRADRTKKVNRRIAKEHNPDSVDFYTWKLGVLGVQAKHIIFVDESAIDMRNGTRKKGWSRRGVRPVQYGRFRRGQRYQLLAALTVDGILYCRIYPGSTNGEIFEEFMRDLLPYCNPFPERRSVVVLDNASIHRSPSIEQMCSVAGVLKINTAPFGPWKNGIEQHFGELKTFVQQYWSIFERDPEQDFAAYLEFCVAEVGSRKHSARGHFRSAGINVEEE